MRDQVSETVDDDAVKLTTEIPTIERIYHVTKLWAKWAEELGYEEADEEAFSKDVISKLSSGKTDYFLLVSGGNPVGFIEVTIDYDPALSANVLFGERAYVVPKWRERGVFREAFAVLEKWAIEERGVMHGLIEVKVEDKFLVDFYEEHGFEVESYKMRLDKTVN